MEGIPEHIARVLDAARTAPSHDNLQPWRFTVSGDTISFRVDYERSPSPEGTMARVAVGAAIECAYVAAARMGATVRLQAPDEGALVTMSVTAPKRTAPPDLARTRRVTNRRLYDGRALDDATLLALREATPQRDLAETHWFGRERVRALGPLLDRAEELLLLDPVLGERALAAIRFDVKDRDAVDYGLSIGSLELSSAERTALASLHRPAGPGAVAAAAKALGARARRLVESASGVCILTAIGDDPMTDVDLGRSLQRAWMVLTQRGIAAHPMTAMMSLASSPGANDDPIAALHASFRRTFPNVPDDARIAFLMRFGWAEAPSCRVGRFPLEDSCVVGS
jgi:hypothetical protein